MAETLSRNGRGFQRVELDGPIGIDLHLQQSSVVGDYHDAINRPGTSAVWIGVGCQRLHLNREQAMFVLRHLRSWVAFGHFAAAEPPVGRTTE